MGVKPAAERLSPQGKLAMMAGTLATLVVGTAMRGDILLVLVHFLKRGDQGPAAPVAEPTSLLERYHMQNVHWFVLASLAISFFSFYSMVGWLNWFFYVKQKDQAHVWKCQPNRWLTPENERHEFIMGSVNMSIGATVSGIIAAHILNDGYHCLYFNMLEDGWVYLVGSTVMLFLIQDALAYYFHRGFHLPWWYKRFHKHHHRYHSPTAWSATAMHPLEFLLLQGVLAVPLFFFRVYSGSFIGLLLYNYYYGMIDHSGIKMDAIWPWQPSSMFHDNHHKYFHTNFGFNCKLWDWMHDTLRKESRTYGEDVFYGKGKENEIKDK